MNKHFMGLFPEPFYNIVKNEKYIEFRLNDAKRKAIKIGDLITFCNVDNKEEVNVKVTGLLKSKTFRDLFFSLKNTDLGPKESEIEEWVQWMRNVYSEADENEFGVLGIQILRLVE